jgi:hypothetical protein
MNNQERLLGLCRKAKELTGIDIRYARGRKEEYVRIRSAISNIAHRHMGMTTVYIGEFFGYSEHSTIVHHKQTHDGRYSSDDDYADIYNSLLRDLPQDEVSTLDVKEVTKMIRECVSPEPQNFEV